MERPLSGDVECQHPKARTWAARWVASAESAPVEAGSMGPGSTCPEVNERHRHRDEVNNQFVPQPGSQGRGFRAHSVEKLPEIMEMPHMVFRACSSIRNLTRLRARPPAVQGVHPGGVDYKGGRGGALRRALHETCADLGRTGSSAVPDCGHWSGESERWWLCCGRLKEITGGLEMPFVDQARATTKSLTADRGDRSRPRDRAGLRPLAEVRPPAGTYRC